MILTLLLSLILTSINNEVLEDRIYDEYIKTVQLYPGLRSLQDRLLPPVVPIQQTAPLTLEFDDINEVFVNYSARILHCDEDWTRSQMRENEYLFEYNIFNIESYDFSLDTRIPYVHYQFLLPRVKLPGNYVVEVFPTDSEDEILFRKRFMVFDNKVSLTGEQSLTQGLVEFAQRNQQINFVIDYQNYPMVNPSERTTVKVLQNHRWDNCIADMRPTFVREDQANIEYRHFTDESTFGAGNEFRFFDLRSVRYPGQNVKTARLHDDYVTASLFEDKPKTSFAYGIQRDNNGKFIIENLDRRNADIESEYVDITFTLNSSPLESGQVYLFGALTNWQLDDKYRMQYDSNTKQYLIESTLKQGWYDYMYYVASPSLNPNYIEGNHFETENTYEILVYYRPIEMRADLLIGYFVVNRNG